MDVESHTTQLLHSMRLVNRRSGEYTGACPHCRENILESAAVCPACKHHVRFDQNAHAANADETLSPLTIEGNFRNPSGDAAWE